MKSIFHHFYGAFIEANEMKILEGKIPILRENIFQFFL